MVPTIRDGVYVTYPFLFQHYYMLYPKSEEGSRLFLVSKPFDLQVYFSYYMKLFASRSCLIQWMPIDFD